MMCGESDSGVVLVVCIWMLMRLGLSIAYDTFDDTHSQSSSQLILLRFRTFGWCEL